VPVETELPSISAFITLRSLIRASQRLVMNETASLAKDLPSLAEAQQKAGNKRKRQIVTAACERCRALRRKVSNIRNEVDPEHL
jgi:hypothetical protein